MRTLLAALLSVALAQGVAAQLQRVHPDPASPHWWTLSDEVSSQELREARTSPKMAHKHLAKAIELGLTTPFTDDGTGRKVRIPLEDPEVSGGLVDFLHTTLTAKYVRLPEALGALLTSLPAYARALHARGITSNDMHLLEEAVRHRDDRYVELRLGLKDDVELFGTVLQRAWEGLSEKEYRSLLRRQNWEGLAEVSDVSSDRLRQAADAWIRSPSTEADVEAATWLKQHLDPASWEGLRAFLLSEVATDIIVYEYADATLE